MLEEVVGWLVTVAAWVLGVVALLVGLLIGAFVAVVRSGGE